MVSFSKFGGKGNIRSMNLGSSLISEIRKKKQFKIHNKLMIKFSWGYKMFWFLFKQTQDAILVNNNCVFSVWILGWCSRQLAVVFLAGLTALAMNKLQLLCKVPDVDWTTAQKCTCSSNLKENEECIAWILVI